MSQVAIHKVGDKAKTTPIFEEIAKRFEAVRQRAFDLFDQRGRTPGHESEDWFQAERELFCWPAAELAEKDGVYQIQVTLAGFEGKNIDVTATSKEIIVHAAREAEEKTEKDNVLWTEFGASDVYRRFELPNPIDVNKVTANLENGVLRINAPETVKTAAKAA